MLVMMFEDRKAEPKQPLTLAAHRLPFCQVDRSNNVMDGAGQEIIFVAEMRIEGGPANVGTIQDLLYRDVVLILLPDQRVQCFTESFLRSRDPPI